MPAVLLALCCVLLRGAAAAKSATWNCAQTDAVCDALGDFYADTGGAGWLYYGSENDGQSATQGWRAADAGLAPDYCTFFRITCVGGLVTELCAACCALRRALAQRRAGC